MNTSSTTTATSTFDADNFVIINGSADWESNDISGKISSEGIHVELYFKYIKRKFGVLEKKRLENRLKKIEKAFEQAIENGQDSLAIKFMERIAKEAKESALYAKGIRYFIEKKDLDKYKHKIRGGHISDTPYEEFTRVIPKRAINKKKKVEDHFDSFVIYHYWNPKADDVKEMDPKEKEKMRDPVLFGMVKESDRLYFIDDWIDDFCDLSFEEIIDELGKDEDEVKLGRAPESIV